MFSVFVGEAHTSPLPVSKHGPGAGWAAAALEGSCLFPSRPRGSLGHWWHHRFSDGGPSPGLLELSQRLKERVGGGTQGCREAPGDLSGVDVTDRACPGFPTEGQWAPVKTESCHLCSCSSLPLGEFLGKGIGWTYSPCPAKAEASPLQEGAWEQPPNTCSWGPL